MIGPQSVALGLLALALLFACSDSEGSSATPGSSAGEGGAGAAGGDEDRAGAATSGGAAPANGGAAQGGDSGEPAAGEGGGSPTSAGAGGGDGNSAPLVGSELDLGFSVDVSAYPLVLAIDDEDGLFIAGNGKNENSEADWWLKKFDADGHEDQTHWNKEVVSQDAPSALAVDTSGSVFVAGASTAQQGWWLKRYDALGVEDTTWNELIDAQFLTDAGLTVSGVLKPPRRMATDSMDSVYLVGAAQVLDKFEVVPVDVWLVLKFGADGQLAWARSFDGGHAWPGEDWAYNATALSLALDSDDNAYVVGQILETGWWLKKLSPAGDDDTTQWGKTLDFGYDAEAWAVAVDSKDDVYVTGSPDTSSDLPCQSKRFHPDGVEDTSWSKPIGCNVGIAVNSTDDVYLPGTNADPSTLTIEKFEPGGVRLRTLLIPNEPNGYLQDFAVDSQDRLFAITDKGVYTFR